MDGRDNTIIEALLKIAQICGTFPSKTISFESFTYQLVIITLTLFNGVYSIYTNAVTYDPDKNAIMIFMEFLISSFTVVLGVSIQLISLRHYKICILFFQNLKVGCVKNSNSRKLSVFLELFAVHLAYFTRLSFIVWAWLPLIGTSALNYFFRHLNEYYSMIYVLLLVHINIVIKRKFLLLNKFLNHSNCIRYVRQNYGKTLQLINNFNIIFGYQILLIVTHAGIALLECLHDCLRFTDFKSIQNKYILFWDIFYSITITIQIVALILSCDGVIAEAKRINEVCAKIHDRFGSSGRNEVVRFLALVEAKKPYYSAAGYFVLNKNTLFAFFSTITMYFIIFLQFQ